MSIIEIVASCYAGIEDWFVSDMVEVLLEVQMVAVVLVYGACADFVCAIEVVAERLCGGGWLIYLGAGMLGWIAMQDAVELVLTFVWLSACVLLLMVGGNCVFIEVIEGAEDDGVAAIVDFDAVSVGVGDVVIGVAVLGRIFYIVVGFVYVWVKGVLIIGVYNNVGGWVGEVCEIVLLAVIGVEVVAGLMWLKAGIV